MPDRDRETSVSRILKVGNPEVWGLGDEVARESGRDPPRAGGEVSTAHVRHCQLKAEPDEPPERHAIVVGWPTEKDKQMSLAQLLAAEATL